MPITLPRSTVSLYSSVTSPTSSPAPASRSRASCSVFDSTGGTLVNCPELMYQTPAPRPSTSSTATTIAAGPRRSLVRRRGGSGGGERKRLVRCTPSAPSSSSFTGRGRGTVSERGMTLVRSSALSWTEDKACGGIASSCSAVSRPRASRVSANSATASAGRASGARAVAAATRESSAGARPGTTAEGAGTSS